MEETDSIAMAEKAFSLCHEAYRARNLPLARIYAMNAITHDSSPKAFELYVEIIKAMPERERRVAVEQALNILSMVMCQCDPDEIGKFQQLATQLEEIQDEGFAPTPETPDVISAPLIDKYSWESLREEGQLENLERIREKFQILQPLIDSGDLHGEELQRRAKEFQETEALLDFLNKKQVFEESLTEVDNELTADNGNLCYVAARLQNAATLLSQLWLVNVAGVLVNYKERLAAMTKRLEKFERQYEKVRSAPLFEELKQKIRAAILQKGLFSYKQKIDDENKKPIVNNQDANAPKLQKEVPIVPLLENAVKIVSEPQRKALTAKFTSLLEVWQKTAMEVSAKLERLSDPDAIAEVQYLLNMLNHEAEKVAKQRYAAYQEFCAEKCQEAIKDYDSITLRVSEGDAIKLFKRWDMAKIDEALLSPEASGFFQTAKGMLMDKMSRLTKAEHQVQCVVSEKFKLEDF